MWGEGPLGKTHRAAIDAQEICQKVLRKAQESQATHHLLPVSVPQTKTQGEESALQGYQ